MFRLLVASILSGSAFAADWPHFLGPDLNATSSETGFQKTLPAAGPKKLWEFAKGAGYACPVVSGDRCIAFYSEDGREFIAALDAATGKKLWSIDYEAPYTPQFGAGEGPRTSPTIADGRVYVSGIAGMLSCVDLATGKVQWQRKLGEEYKLSPTFFGHGGSPLVAYGKLIVSLGTEDGKSVVALDPATGKELWAAKSKWGASYASPVLAKFHGKECVLAFQGGMDQPPTGGLLLIDAADGKVLGSVEHRAKMWASVSASSPVVVANSIFVSEAYTEGGLSMEVMPDFSLRPAWRAKNFDTYFTTAVADGGVLYGFAGQHQRNAELACYDVTTGKEKWRDDLSGTFQRGSLLKVDGAYLAIGENGDFAWLSLSPNGAKVLSKTKLFYAPETWTSPALSNGRLFVAQNQPGDAGSKPRIICYELAREPKK